MDDLISRCEAIDRFNLIRPAEPRKSEYTYGIGVGIAMCIVTIKDQSSAQPEIVRCRDCKYWMPHSQLGYDEDNETYHDYCERLIPEDEYYAFYRDADDYCSRAERRTDEDGGGT